MIRSRRRGSIRPGSQVLKVDCDGKIKLERQHWVVSRALAGERVQLVTIEGRVLVYYCRTLIRELDLDNQRSTIVDRWLGDETQTETVKDVPGQTVKDVVGLDKQRQLWATRPTARRRP